MRKAQVLIVTVFLMLALSMITWTVVNFVNVDMQAAGRNLDSERALYIAEAGLNWAMGKVTANASWLPSSADNLPHKFATGEYDVTSYNANGPLEMISTGYVPGKDACLAYPSECRGRRTVSSSAGGVYIDKLIQANHDFDWSQISLSASPKSSFFDGDIAVGNIVQTVYGFERNGDGARNTANVDYSNSTTNLLPPASVSPAAFTRGDKASYPGVDIDLLRDASTTFWPGSTPAYLDRNLRVMFSVFSLGNMWTVENDLAQSFSKTSGGANYSINKIRVLHGRNYGTPTGSVTVRIETNTGSAANGRPSGNTVPGWPATPVTYKPTASRWNEVNLPATINNLSRNTTYWLVLNAPNQANDSRYTIRAADYSGPAGLLYGLVGSWNGAATERQTDPELAFEIFNGVTLQAGASRANVYIRSMPFILGDSNGAEYDCAQSFMIRPWWPSATVTRVGTRHRPHTGNPSGAINVRIETNNDNGTPDDLNDDRPSGTLVTAAAVTSYSPPDSNAETYANFAQPVVLSYDDQAYYDAHGTRAKYWIVWDAPNQSSNNYYNLSAAGYKYGSSSLRINGGAWSVSAEPDIFFHLVLASGDTIGINSDSYFFNNPATAAGTPMTGMILKNYSIDASRSLTGEWQDNEWGVIGNVDDVVYNDIAYYPGESVDNKYAAKVSLVDSAGNARAVDWYDTDEVQIAYRVTSLQNNNTTSATQRLYVAAGMMFDSSAAAINQYNKGFTAERDLGILGSQGVVLQAPQNATAPLLATEFGNIYSGIPSTSGNAYAVTRRRTLAGLIYTNTGNVTFDYLCATDSGCPPAGSVDMGAAIVGNNVTMKGFAYMDGDSTRIAKGGSFLIGSSDNRSWGEE